MELHIIYTEQGMLLSKQSYSSWREIQDEYPGYTASLGPWSAEEVIEYLDEEYPDLAPSAKQQVDALLASTQFVHTVSKINEGIAAETSKPLLPYKLVRVITIRDDRFKHEKISYQRLPNVGDQGTILEVHTIPQVAYEVECSDPQTGETVWLEAMYPDELGS